MASKNEYAALAKAAAEVEAGTAAIMPASALSNAVAWVTKAASKDDARRVLTGVLVAFTGDRVLLVATDSYRLHIAELTASAPWAEEDKAAGIVAARASSEYTGGERVKVPGLRELTRSGKGDAALELVHREIVHEGRWCQVRECDHAPEDHLKGGRCTHVSRGIACKCKKWTPHVRTETQGELLVTVGYTTSSLKLIDGDYPNWRQLLPSDAPITARFEASRLAAVLPQLAEAEKIRVNAELKRWENSTRRDPRPVNDRPITLSVKRGTVQVGYNHESATAGCKAETSGTIRLGLNAKYLAELLTGFSDEVTMIFSTDTKPVLAKEGQRTGLLMPVRIS